MLSCLHQPLKDGIGGDLKDAGHGPNAQAFGQRGQCPHQCVKCDAYTMQGRAMELLDGAGTRHALQLPPGTAARMAMSVNVTTSQSAVIGAVLIGAAVMLGIDRAPAASGKDDHWRGCPRSLRTRIEALLTCVAEGFVD